MSFGNFKFETHGLGKEGIGMALPRIRSVACPQDDVAQIVVAQCEEGPQGSSMLL